nr:zinc finger, CCHC-type [Tanacetum cinerariifolium]
MLLELTTLFAQQVEQELLQTTRDFHSCKQEEGKSVSSYVLKMKGYIDNLERLGYPVTLGLGVSLILIGLRKEFNGFVQNYNMHSPEKTINELHAMLKLHEQTLPKNNAPALHAIRAGKVQKVNKQKKSQPQMAARGQNHRKGKNKLAYAPKPKIPPPPKREDPAKDSISYKCERRNRTLLDMVRSMMSQTTLPKPFWDYALETAARILNMVLTKKVEKTPYEVWHGQAPKMSYLKVWGCEVYKDTTCQDRMCLYIDAEEHELGDLGELTNYKAALLDHESEK